ncbi:hypothetical protein F5880DRAFT_1703764, partial [Lentinula raphanica]
MTLRRLMKLSIKVPRMRHGSSSRSSIDFSSNVTGPRIADWGRVYNTRALVVLMHLRSLALGSLSAFLLSESLHSVSVVMAAPLAVNSPRLQ